MLLILDSSMEHQTENCLSYIKRVTDAIADYKQNAN